MTDILGTPPDTHCRDDVSTVGPQALYTRAYGTRIEMNGRQKQIVQTLYNNGMDDAADELVRMCDLLQSATDAAALRGGPTSRTEPTCTLRCAALARWADALAAEGNSLGDILQSYAANWQADIAELRDALYDGAALDAAVAAERERCLEICERHYSIEFIAQDIAADIRGPNAIRTKDAP